MAGAANGDAARGKLAPAAAGPELDLCKGHLSMLRLTCAYFFILGAWVWSSLCWLRSAELMVPLKSLERHMIEPKERQFALELHPWLTAEPPCFLAFVACIVGFITSLVWAATFRATPGAPDVRLGARQSLTLLACLYVALTNYVVTAEDLPDFFNNNLFDTTKELLELGQIVFMGNVLMLMDMNIMPVVHVLRLSTALNFTTYGMMHHVYNQKCMHWREMLLTHFSPTPLAATFYHIPEPLVRYFNFFVVSTTMFPGSFVYVLPDTAARTVFVYLGVLAQVFFMLTRNGPVPALVKICMLLGCQIRDRPASGVGRYGIVTNLFRLFTISYFLKGVWTICGNRVSSNFGVLLRQLLFDPASLVLKYYNGGLRTHWNKLDVALEMRGYDIPPVLYYLVPGICAATLAGILLRGAHQLLFTRREHRTKTWIGALAKAVTFVLAVGMAAEKFFKAVEGLNPADENSFIRMMPVDPYGVVLGAKFAHDVFSIAIFNTVHSYNVKPDYVGYIGRGNIQKTSTVEREAHFDYLRHSRDDLWFVIESKYSPPYDINTPMRCAPARGPTPTPRPGSAGRIAARFSALTAFLPA